jgi:SAM-dependent methyltransferase
MGKPAWEHAIRLAHVRAGTRFLDVGCGAGGASMVADRYQARITGLDAAPPLIAIARERLPNAAFNVGEMEELSYPDGSFDIVFACNSLQYAANPNGALLGFRQVMAPHGLLVIVLWGLTEDCEMEMNVFPAVRKTMPPPPAGTPRPLGLSDPGVLDGLLQASGFDVRASEFVDVLMEYPDMDYAWRAQKSAGPLQRAIQVVGEPTVKKAVVDAMRPFTSPSGMVRMRNKFRIVVAKRD